MKKILIIFLIITVFSSVVYAQSWNNIEYDIPDQFHFTNEDENQLTFADDKNNTVSLEVYNHEKYSLIQDRYNMLSYNKYQLNEKQINETHYNHDDSYIYTYIFELNNQKYIVYYNTTEEGIYVTNTFNPAHTLINSLKY